MLLWNRPDGPVVSTLILAHGAGAPMDSPFMDDMAQRLAARGIAVVRFEFPYMAARREDGRRRPPNPQAQLLACWREIHVLVRQQVTGRLAIGGKSMGGRMASLLADELGVDALVCLGYPFHAVGKADKPRVAHLADLNTPTLIVQGERDPMGDRLTVTGYSLSDAIRMHWLVAGDHDLKPLKASGLTHEQHLQSAADEVAKFLTA
ncbi:alpha/beta hydrolase [Pseudomonas sp. BN417]|uniref:alpha/beta family hydrolase n=1 Tax=Pseudomonas sp. BN417 TaxID=2567890 RepID=UPI00245470E9|nr:alpha/beta family hydrolase [Pseudomonas sp. BN417]MDH4556819.1 alpha/beta hydrolase [Pseudomonas sp. BN417]